MDDADASSLRFRDVREMHLITEVFNRTTIPGMNAAKHLDQGGFASTVFAHQSMYLTGLQLEINRIQSMNTSEILVDALHPQNRISHSNITFHFLCQLELPFLETSILLYVHKNETIRL